jgi:hypothetical protein
MKQFNRRTEHLQYLGSFKNSRGSAAEVVEYLNEKNRLRAKYRRVNKDNDTQRCPPFRTAP